MVFSLELIFLSKICIKKSIIQLITFIEQKMIIPLNIIFNFKNCFILNIILYLNKIKFLIFSSSHILFLKNSLKKLKIIF